MAGGLTPKTKASKATIKTESTLDYNLQVLKKLNFKKKILIIGKDKEKIIRSYNSDFDIIENTDWHKTDNLYSLSLAENLLNGITLISYGDIIFNENAITRLLNNMNNDFVLAYDSAWDKRYIYRSKISLQKIELIIKKNNLLQQLFKGNNIRLIPDGEFCGLFLISPKGSQIISKLIKTFKSSRNFCLKKSKILDLINFLLSKKYLIDVVDIAGNWSEMDDLRDIKSFIFKGKADTLNFFRNSLKKAKILPQINFTVEQWNKKSSFFLDKLTNKKWPLLIIRSSARNEDNFTSSMAGKYSSILNVPNNKIKLKSAINEVIKSMVLHDEVITSREKSNKVLVQPFLEKVDMSGVAFSLDLKNASPYYVINFDRNNNTEGVTSGKSKTQEIVYISRISKLNKNVPSEFNQVINLLKELEKKTSSFVDIEFGFKKNQIYLFQVRPLIISSQKNIYYSDDNIKYNLKKIKNIIKQLWKPNKDVFGKSNLLSDMTDWNPAEIIGVSPNPLAISLYQYLITDEIWATSRRSIGYNAINSQKLMIVLAGHPFINIRNSFNSLIPNNLTKSLGNKLVNFYLKKLNEDPTNHDKVEFNIVHSCFTPQFENDKIELMDNNFTNKELQHLEHSLKKLTANIFVNKNISIQSYLKKIKYLEKNFNKIKKKSYDYQLLILLEDCIKNGTFPFSILARYSFIAIKIIKDMEKTKLISLQSMNKFLDSIETIATENNEMYKQVESGNISLKTFLSHNGHLRPGTYDLLQFRYDQKPDLYFNFNNNEVKKKKLIRNNYSSKSYSEIFKKNELSSINNFMKLLSPTLNADNFLDFTKKAIQSREYAKFQFTKVLSHILEIIKKWGKKNGLDSTQIVYLKISDIIENIINEKKENTRNNVINEIEFNKRKFEINKQIRLPSFISSSSQVEAFKISRNKPSFITNKSITSNFIYIKSINETINVVNKIILIDNADPGFDWLFMHDIKGLITKYGGVASHMAIRCNEFNLPAAIGCGDLIFEQLIIKSYVVLDCKNEMITGY